MTEVVSESISHNRKFQHAIFLFSIILKYNYLIRLLFNYLRSELFSIPLLNQSVKIHLILDNIVCFNSTAFN